jgi:putative membrane protein
MMRGMQAFLTRLVITGVAIWVAALIIPGVGLGQQDTGEQIVTVLLVALIFGVVNAVLGPIVRTLTFPLYLLTLGLFSLVVNALLLGFTAWLAGQLDLAFTVDGFWAAVGGALVVSLVTMALGAFAKKR